MRDLTSLPDLQLALIQTSLVWQDASANREHFRAPAWSRPVAPI